MKKEYVRPAYTFVLMESEPLLGTSSGKPEEPAARNQYSSEEMMTRRKRMWKDDLWDE